jgi:hypothetical protein
MPRERWFFAQGGARRGPLGLGPLLSALVQEKDPRAALVWRRGFAEWTRAEDVPEIEQQLAPLLARPTGRFRRLAVATNVPATGSGERRAPSGRPAAVAGLVLVAALIAGVAAWKLVVPRFGTPPALPLGAPNVESAPAVLIPATPGERPQASAAPAAPSAPSATARASPVAAPSARPTSAPPLVADREADLPVPELRKLRGVAVWSGDNLKLTVYNGTAWRVTELSVRVGRFVRDDFAYDASALRLLPPAGPVDTGVADLLLRVAPDRKKPGLNPLDTGAFEAPGGAAPESFRWEIESARGYPPAGARE